MSKPAKKDTIPGPAFVRWWESSASLAEFEKKVVADGRYYYSAAAARQRRKKYVEKGVPLRDYPRKARQQTDYDKLKALCLEVKAQVK